MSFVYKQSVSDLTLLGYVLCLEGELFSGEQFRSLGNLAALGGLQSRASERFVRNSCTHLGQDRELRPWD